MTNDTGSTCFSADYYPYGQEIDYTTSCSPTYKFTGYEFDSETGNYYAYTRYYSPRLGRFMSPDLLAGNILNPQSLNGYAYVLNDPESLIDSLGLCAQGQVMVDGKCETNTTVHVTATPVCYAPPTGGDPFAGDSGGLVAYYTEADCASAEYYAHVWGRTGAFMVPPRIAKLLQRLEDRSQTLKLQVENTAQEIVAEQKDAVNKGYYSCIGHEMFPFAGLLSVGAGKIAEEGLTAAVENGARWIAGAYYHFTDARFTAWGAYSKVMVPRAADTIETAAYWAKTAGWGITDAELAAAIHKCSEKLQ